jgi:hypothetical protein
VELDQPVADSADMFLFAGSQTVGLKACRSPGALSAPSPEGAPRGVLSISAEGTVRISGTGAFRDVGQIVSGGTGSGSVGGLGSGRQRVGERTRSRLPTTCGRGGASGVDVYGRSEHVQRAKVDQIGARLMVRTDLASCGSPAHLTAFVERAPTSAAGGNRQMRGALPESVEYRHMPGAF